MREALLRAWAEALRADPARGGGSRYDDLEPAARARLLHLLCCELMEADPR